MLNRTMKVALAAATLAGGFSAMTATPASARQLVIDVYENNDVCYRARKIPAQYRVDTKGILVSGSSRTWRGNMQRNGALIVNKYNDPVYIQTREQIEEQHTTLIPVACR